MTHFLRRIPLYGDLFVSKPDRLKEAFHDLFVTTLFSMFPIWLYPAFTSLFLTKPTPFFAEVVQNVWGGELFLFSAALVGPLIYAITKRYSDPSDKEESSGGVTSFFKRKYEFPYGQLFTYLSMAICVFAALCFGALKASDSLGMSGILNEKSLFIFSLIMYVFTLSCFYCVSVYRLNLDNVAADYDTGERDLMDEWGEHDD